MSECSGHCDSCSSKSEGCENLKLNLRMNSIQHKIFVLSGKGGVGKSTVAAGLAVTLAKQGKKVGLLDVDFHGPSQPTLFNLHFAQPEATAEGSLLPNDAAGVKLISIGLLLENPDSAVIWRGPAKIGVLKQLLEDVEWGALDALILDFPPGTGDEILSAVQMIPGDKKAILVTTPQEVALADCRKCLDFCAQLQLQVAGVVENMSYFLCGKCGTKHELFSNGGGKKLAESHHLPLLAQLPMEPEFMASCDSGNLPAALQKSPAIHDAFEDIAKGILL